jgi:hypothetical protein
MKTITTFALALVAVVTLLAPVQVRAQEIWDPEKTLGITIEERLEGSDPISKAEIAALGETAQPRGIQTVLMIINATPYPLTIWRGREGRNPLGAVPPGPIPTPIPVFDWAGDTIIWARTFPGLPQRYWKKTFQGNTAAAAWTVSGPGTEP